MGDQVKCGVCKETYPPIFDGCDTQADGCAITFSPGGKAGVQDSAGYGSIYDGDIITLNYDVPSGCGKYYNICDTCIPTLLDNGDITQKALYMGTLTEEVLKALEEDE